MFIKGIVFVMLMLTGGIFALLSLIMTLIKFSGNQKGAWKWLIGFIAGSLLLIGSVFFFTKKIIGKTQQFAEHMAQLGLDQVRNLDSLNKSFQMREDSLLQTERVTTLITMEPADFKGAVPSRFYTYLGFKDYYRMPLIYPYSLHCNDSLNHAQLFDERLVRQFDVNDNGEQYCDIDNIRAFYFGKDLMVGSRIKTQKESPVYFSYNFMTKESKTFKTEKELRNFMIAKGFKGNEKFFTCRAYYEAFNP